MSGAMERLGPFQVQSVLGEGGSATVYLALWEGREIALKVEQRGAIATERQRARFLDESRLLARVKHPNLIEVLASGTLPDGRAYLAMPRLYGQTLAQRSAFGPLPLERALTIFEALAGAVAALHDAGLVHRDLKPENVFLVDQGTPILLDLGIAKDTAAPPTTTTQDGFVKGTPATMAPERFFGAPATQASDVYELALVLYVMLTARLPWDHGSTDVDARLHGMSPNEAGADVPPALSDEIMAALSTRVERRPRSVRELAERIRAGAAGNAAPERRTAAMPKRTSTPPAKSAASAASAASAGAHLTLRSEHRTLPQLPKQTPVQVVTSATPQAPSTAPRRWRVPVAIFAGAAAIAAVLAGGRLLGTRRSDVTIASDPTASAASAPILVTVTSAASAAGEMSFEVSPPNAEIVWDQRKLAAGERVPADGRSHVLHVAAVGYEPIERTVVADRAQAYVVSLAASPAPSAAASRASGAREHVTPPRVPAAASASREPKREPRVGQAPPAIIVDPNGL